MVLSPIPGFLLPKSAGNINFNIPMGLDINDFVGINTDIVSEPIFFFGGYGWLFGALIFSLIVITPIELVKRGILKGLFHRICFQVAILYFFGAGYAMQLRSASRYFWYVLIITLTWNYFKPSTNKVKEIVTRE